MYRLGSACSASILRSAPLRFSPFRPVRCLAIQSRHIQGLTGLSDVLLEAKRMKNLSFEELGRHMSKNEVWVASVVYRQNTPSADEAQKLCQILGINDTETVKALTIPCTKGLGPKVPTDPVIYRLYEILQVYGYPIKEIIHEKFGDGIMSAINLTIHVDKVQGPPGDRVKLTLEGKFLPYSKW